MPGMSETELKLLLPGADPAQVAQVLGRHPALRRRACQVQTLHNVYYDTPEQDLRRQKVALRVRRLSVDTGPGDRWILTLKTAGTSVGGLSQRGEWEAPLPDGTPRRAALAGTPWDGLDPDGQLWPRLAPCFVTTCTRSLWQVRQRDRSHIEVALDVGEIVAGGRRLPLCELELELVQGPTEALHILALRLAEILALLPGQASKAERGYALALDAIAMPTRAQPVALRATQPLGEAAATVLSEIWDQTLRNTAVWMQTRTPEALHQARVGWRRLRALTRLWRPVLGAPPDAPALRDFLNATGPVRELDVMRTETLPRWTDGLTAGQPARAAAWAQALEQVAQAHKAAMATASAKLAAPACGRDWLAWGAWIGALAKRPGQVSCGDAAADWPAWVRRRLQRQHRRLQRFDPASAGETERHAMRLRAKRLRYSAEALAAVLRRREARRWVRQASRAQQGEGDRRDLLQCVAWLERLDAPDVVVAYLQGVAQGVLSR